MMRLVRDGGPRPLAAPGLLPLPGRPRRGRAFRVLVLGGARSGKSVTAERMLAERDQVDYVACGLPADDSDPVLGRAGAAAPGAAARALDDA